LGIEAATGGYSYQAQSEEANSDIAPAGAFQTRCDMSQGLAALALRPGPSRASECLDKLSGRIRWHDRRNATPAWPIDSQRGELYLDGLNAIEADL